MKDNVIYLDTFKKTRDEDELATRLSRINASLEKINKLMKELENGSQRTNED